MSQEQMSNIKTLLQPWKEGIQKQQSQLKKTASSLRQERFELYKKKDFENDSYLVVGVIVHQGMFISQTEEVYFRWFRNSVITIGKAAFL